MRQIILFLLAVFTFVFTACSSEKDEAQKIENQELKLNSSLSETDFKKICKSFERIVNTRSCLNNEDSCKLALQPLINDGKLIQRQILVQAEFNTYFTKEDLQFFENLSEEQLATLSFSIHELNQVIFAERLDTTEMSDSITQMQSVNINKILDCLSFAFGITVVKQLSVKGIITATTLRQALIAVGKRYLGYVGVVLMIADFYDCFYG